MLTLTLIRHTATAYNAQRRYQGHSDPPLSPEGESQARGLKELLRATLERAETPGPRDRLDRQGALGLATTSSPCPPTAGPAPDPATLSPLVYASDLTRAARTAALAAPGAAVILDRRLRELDFGVFDGRTYDENLAEHGDHFRAWVGDPETVRPPRGETLSELDARVAAWLDALPPEGHTVVFTHGGPIRAIVARVFHRRFAALRVPPGDVWRLLLPTDPAAPVPLPVRLQDFVDGCGRRRAAARFGGDPVPLAAGDCQPLGASQSSARSGKVGSKTNGTTDSASTPATPRSDHILEITDMTSSDPSRPIDDRPPHPRAPRPKQRTPGPYRIPPRERRHGLVIVNTGNGKGKTTAALGLLLRATGRDMRVAMLQFVKSADVERGEHVAARRLGVEILPLGAGFTWLSQNLAVDQRLARDCWRRCVDVLDSGEYDVVIFDELTYALKYGWLNHDEVFNALRARPQGTHVVITGRAATPELIEFADLVTEMREVKHPYRTVGLGAQPGVEL